MEGGEPFPGDNRHISGYATPKSFVPQYGKSTTKDAGDIAEEENAERVKKMEAEEAKKAAEAEEVQKAREKETLVKF